MGYDASSTLLESGITFIPATFCLGPFGDEHWGTEFDCSLRVVEYYTGEYVLFDRLHINGDFRWRVKCELEPVETQSGLKSSIKLVVGVESISTTNTDVKNVYRSKRFFANPCSTDLLIYLRSGTLQKQIMVQNGSIYSDLANKEGTGLCNTCKSMWVPLYGHLNGTSCTNSHNRHCK